jgi:recombinational DNA repair protein RecR
MDHIEELARALARFPGIGPRQGKRFVYYLLAAPADSASGLPSLSQRWAKMSASARTVCVFITAAVQELFVIIVPTKRAMIRS